MASTKANSENKSDSMEQNQDDDMKATANTDNNQSSAPNVQIQDTLQVQFVTKIADASMQCDDTIYALPSNLDPKALSKVINHILKKQKEEDQIDFDFLLKNEYISKSLKEHLFENEISSEEKLVIEYIEKTIEPSAKSSDQHPDWVSCLDALKNDLFITGCYDGIIRCWKDDEQLFTQYRGHIAPIKGITALYRKQDIHYFATVAKDRSTKVFGLNETTKEIKQVSKVDIKSASFSHRFAVDCCSAPYPSKVFATGSADKEIRIYRMKNADNTELDKIIDDTNDNDDNGIHAGPPSKKRKLNDLDIEGDANDNKMEIEQDGIDDKAENVGSCRLANISILRAHNDAIKCLDWNNPFALYSGSWDNCMKLWDIHKEIDSYTWNTQSGVNCIKYWNAQNVLISAHANQKIAIWDPRTDQIKSNKTMSVMTFRSHRLPITGIDVDGMNGIDDNNDKKLRNSDYLFITSSHDGKLKIWDIRSKSPLYTIEKHQGKVLCVGWYGNTIISGGSDNKLRAFKWSRK